MSRPFVIGVTGNIACGKSAVSQRLAAHGATVIDADEVYHRLVAPGAPLVQDLRRHFGDTVVRPDGSLDRAALGALVFSDPSALAALDRLTHPPVVAEIQRLVTAAASPVVAVDAVKLIESDYAAECDQVWVVTCDREEQERRLAKRNRIPLDEARRRIAAQPPLPPKLAAADVVIDNSGQLDATYQQVDAAWDAVTRHGAH